MNDMWFPTELNLLLEADQASLTNPDWLQFQLGALPFNSRLPQAGSLAKCLAWLSDKKIKTYLEVGPNDAALFMVMLAYLSKFEDLEKATAINFWEEPNGLMLSARNQGKIFQHTDPNILPTAAKASWDLVVLNKYHPEQVFRRDWNLVKKNARIVLFTDLQNEEVGRTWEKAKKSYESVDFGKVGCLVVTAPMV